MSVFLIAAIACALMAALNGTTAIWRASVGKSWAHFAALALFDFALAVLNVFNALHVSQVTG